MLSPRSPPQLSKCTAVLVLCYTTVAVKAGVPQLLLITKSLSLGALLVICYTLAI